MIRLLLLALAIACGLCGQLRNLATSADGSSLHFSACAALKSETATVVPCRIYAHGESPKVVASTTEEFAISAPYLSADGNLVGAFGNTQSSRAFRLGTSDQALTYAGEWLAVSRNGRFVGALQAEANLLTIHDRMAGTTRTAAAVGSPVYTNGTISDGGDIVLHDASHLWYLPYDGPRRVLLEGQTTVESAITADGSLALALTAIPPGRLEFRTRYTLLAFHLQTGARQVLYDGFANLRTFTMSARGNQVLVQTPDELLLWDRAAGWSNLLTHSEGFDVTQISDDGTVVFARTVTGRLLRIDVASRQLHQLYAPSPDRGAQASRGAYPGSILRLSLNALMPDLSVVVEGRSLPVTSDQGLDVQIPWEATDWIGREAFAEVSTADSPFVLRIPVRFAAGIEPWSFTWHSFSGFGKFSEEFLVAASEDFSSRIDLARPARPGEVVHFWLTGLGPLDQPLRTGQQGPRVPLARPLAPLSCSIAAPGNSQPRSALPVLDVTYAPDWIGVYQVDIRIPADWAATRADVRCNSGQSPTTGGWIAILP